MKKTTLFQRLRLYLESRQTRSTERDRYVDTPFNQFGANGQINSRLKALKRQEKQDKERH